MDSDSTSPKRSKKHKSKRAKVPLSEDGSSSSDLVIVDEPVVTTKLKTVTPIKSSPSSSNVSNPSNNKKRKKRDSASSDEERWLTAIESGKLEDVDDELKKIKPKDPALMTARQRAMYDRGAEGASVVTPTLMSLPTGYKEKAYSEKWFSSTYTWILMIDSEKTLLLSNYPFGLNSRIFMVKPSVDGYEIKSIYKQNKNSNLSTVYDVGTWDREQGFLASKTYSKDSKRSNLHRMPIRVTHVATKAATLDHLEDYREKHQDPITKVNWKLTNDLVRMINATLVNKFINTWGYQNKSTGLYSGMIGDLQTDVADLGGTPCFLTYDRVDIVDFIPFTTPTKMKFIFRAPPLSYVANVFTLPFNSNVWYCCFALVVLIFIVVLTITKWEWRDDIFREKLCLKYYPLRPNPSDVIVMELGAITQQGSECEPKSNAGRIATIFTFIALMFLYTSYSANIVALLQSTTESIRSLEDLLHSRISLGVEDIVYAHYYFETSMEPIRKSIYQQKVAPKGQKPNFMTVDEGVKRVQKDFFAFHVELSSAYKMIGDIFQENEKCGLKEIEFVSLVDPHMTMAKNSEFKEIFRIGLQRIHETGIRTREYNKIYTKKPICHGKGSNFGSAGLIDCYGAFLIFGVGLGCSAFVLLLEITVLALKT